MKLRITATVLLLVATGALNAQESRPASENRPPRGNRTGVPAGLGGSMRDMGQAFDRLMKEAIDPTKKEAALNDVILMERDAGIAKTGVPDNVRNLTGDEKAKALAEYRGDITKLQRALLDLEDALNAGKTDDINPLMEKIGQIAKAGHERFNPQ